MSHTTLFAVARDLAFCLRDAQDALRRLPTDGPMYYLRGSIDRALGAYETAVAAIVAQPATTPAPDVSAAASAAARGTQQPMVPLAVATYLFDTLQKWRELAELPDHATSDSLRAHTKRAGEYYTAAKDKAGMPVTDVGNEDYRYDELRDRVTSLANSLHKVGIAGDSPFVTDHSEVTDIMAEAYATWLGSYAVTAWTPTDIIRRVRQYIDDLPQDDQAVTETHLDELRLLLSDDQD